MMEPNHPRTPPTVKVTRDEEAVDLRAWARAYVNILCTFEGVALVPSALKQAS